uniref:(northern house mosquito) hypothetical protein n=1 Tax=Culex pipiens TaxID=7175 RepID=A0A8D8CPF7_CULPI
MPPLLSQCEADTGWPTGELTRSTLVFALKTPPKNHPRHLFYTFHRKMSEVFYSDVAATHHHLNHLVTLNTMLPIHSRHLLCNSQNLKLSHLKSMISNSLLVNPQTWSCVDSTAYNQS